MTFLHLSDLHLGKRVNDFSMLEDQAHILQQILDIADTEHPDGVLIAGDIYDKPVPPTAAVELFDNFLTALSEKNLSVFLISGNHDSAERLAFGGRLMKLGGVHVADLYTGEIRPITLHDEYGEVDVFLLSFVKPAQVRHCFADEDIRSYTDAVAAAIAHMPLNPARRHVLVTHQFVAGASTCESEELSVGGSDCVDASVFAPFDYVALGHLHAPQSVSRETVRYCGTPLKYSFSEVHHQKSVTLVTLKDKGDVTVRTVPLTPLREMYEIKGSYLELTARAFYENTPYHSAYMHITLTDEEDIPDAIGKLRVIYPFIMKLDYDNHRTRAGAAVFDTALAAQRQPLELFEELFEQQNGQPMSEEQYALAQTLIDTVWEEDTV